ncbi:hypothetical protein SBOR_2922 [Sclerotinia borealis F-4128]|uniref:Sphingoid long-chain base transporter RSB1 n=1 Tax=Sclerotinia borealis (strain F-4128) TaxID=1432307 RepID=W9CKX4_SCLBF|nr:hypothetical protein SBOR_2922 [Sclerotinia borealis F-4128]
MASYVNCLKVSDECPISATAYGYTPSLAANATLLAIFSIITLAQMIQGVKYRTWGFMATFVLGSLCEVVGYAGRVMMASNPWSHVGLTLQSLCLTIGPLFFLNGVFLCYTNIIETYSPTLSRINLITYPLIATSTTLLPFILLTSGSLLQSTSAIGFTPSSYLPIGSHLVIAGLSFQLLAMICFGLLHADFKVQVRAYPEQLNAYTENTRSSRRFRFFYAALPLAFLGVGVSVVYRMAVLGQGWGMGMMKNEVAFVCLEGIIVAIAGSGLSLLHPGYVFRPTEYINQWSAKIIAEEKLEDAWN